MKQFDWETFHKLWGNAKDSPTYDKSVWRVLQLDIELMERQLAEWQIVMKTIERNGPDNLRALLYTLKSAQ